MQGATAHLEIILYARMAAVLQGSRNLETIVRGALHSVALSIITSIEIGRHLPVPVHVPWGNEVIWGLPGLAMAAVYLLGLYLEPQSRAPTGVAPSAPEHPEHPYSMVTGSQGENVK